MAATPPNISEFFRGQSVLITGGLGFLGKVLVEKLLWSCPDIGPIYLLLRGKKGQDPEERLRKSLDLPVFDRIQQEKPEVLEKLVVIPGDIMSLGLGISQHHRSILEEKVSVIFHVAATIRFNDTIKRAVLMNVRGTREILELATNMKNLKVLVYTSTAYSNTNRLVVGEEVYPMKEDWRKIIKVVEMIDEALLDPITEKLIGMRPNTYTYTKSLAEQMVLEYREKLPVIIYRPTIVVTAHKEPVPGWTDSFNGPVSLFLAMGKGIMRALYCDPDICIDYIPVDTIIKGIVTAAWVEGTTQWCPKVPVYNASFAHHWKYTNQDYHDLCCEMVPEAPYADALWLPSYKMTKRFPQFYIRFLLTELLPAIAIDCGLMVARRKPMLVKIQRQIYSAKMTVQYFGLREWVFKNDKFMALNEKLLPEDWEAWRDRLEDIDFKQYMLLCFTESRRYLLKEEVSTTAQGKAHYNRLVWLDRIFRGISYSTLLWVLYYQGLLHAALANLGQKMHYLRVIHLY